MTEINCIQTRNKYEEKNQMIQRLPYPRKQIPDPLPLPNNTFVYFYLGLTRRLHKK